MKLTYATSAAGAAVATAAVPRAAEIALTILGEGGNAYDAAVAAALVETVWLPMKCGLAGDVVALVCEPDGSIEALLSIGPGAGAFAPAALTVVGPRSVGVPGAPDGYSALAARGRFPLARLAAPAIEAAESGVSWLPIAVELTAEAETKLRKWNGPVAFLPEGRLPREGEALRQPGAVRVLAAFAEFGPELFWHDLGQRFASRLAKADGLVTAEDLKVRPARWCPPLRTDLGAGLLLAVTPAPTDGIRLVSALGVVLGEGASPVAAMEKATALAAADGGTSVVAVGDAEGRGVIVVHSNSFPNYGSGVVVEDLDLVLNNRPGRGFDIEVAPDHPNAPAPGRVPRTTLHAWALERADGVHLGATPGGVNQAPWNLQTILELSAGDGAADAVVAPRWGRDAKGQLIVEADHPDRLQIGGREIPPLTQRSVQQMIVRRGDGWLAAADPRLGATARAIAASRK